MTPQTSTRLLSSEHAALVIIDVQEKLLPIIIEKERLVSNIIKLIKFARIVNIPIVVTQQYTKGLGQTIKEIYELLPEVQPVEKTSFSCFGSKQFSEKLKHIGASTLIITGIEAHVCVCQTALDALNDYRVCVVSDAVSSHVKEDIVVALERMGRCGVIIASTDMLMYEILKDADTDEFKQSRNLFRTH